MHVFRKISLGDIKPIFSLIVLLHLFFDVQIPSFITSGLVALCVILTLIQVIGLMYLSGFEINVITATLLILAVGFSVDYSVHMAHYFMNAQGVYEQNLM